jgi:hypothetical protein
VEHVLIGFNLKILAGWFKLEEWMRLAHLTRGREHLHPPTLVEAIVAMLVSREEKRELLRMLVQNFARPDGRKVVLQNLKIVLIQTSWRRIRQYSMSPPNHWMLIHRFTMMEAKFELLHCTKYQKTQFVAQQLQDFANNWWATYTTTVAHDHEVTYGMSSRTPFVPIMSKKGS